MTDYKEEADTLIESFIPHTRRLNSFWGVDEKATYSNAIQCAILSQQRVVDELELIHNWYQSTYITERLTKAKDILADLKSRL